MSQLPTTAPEYENNVHASEFVSTNHTQDCPNFSRLDSYAISLQLAQFSESVNALLPVHSLPLDVLSDILKDSCSDEWALRSSLRFSLVCRRWRHLILGTTWSWTDIRVGNLQLASICFQRARQASISLRLMEEYHRTEIGRDLIDVPIGVNPVGVDLLIANEDRIRKLEVHVHRNTVPMMFPRLAELKTHTLQRMDIFDMHQNIHYGLLNSACHVGAAFAAQNLFATETVRHLMLIRLNVPDPIIGHPNLTSLTLHLSYAPMHPLHLFLGTMHASPMLEYLCIIIAAPIVAALQDGIVWLPHLRHFFFQMLTADDASQLLNYMTVPDVSQAEFILLDNRERSPLLQVPSILQMLRLLPLGLQQNVTYLDLLHMHSPPTLLSMRATGYPEWEEELSISLILPYHSSESCMALEMLQLLPDVFTNLSTGAIRNQCLD